MEDFATSIYSLLGDENKRGRSGFPAAMNHGS
jgi:hypothetical protein